jgi:preprotein translocase SecE subunit
VVIKNMASETKTSKQDEEMDADETANDEPRAEDRRDDNDRERRQPAERATPAKPGFFTIYKKGQGYWTRMGTAIGAGLLGALMTWQIYRYIPAFFSSADPTRPQRIALIVAGVFALLYAILAWRMMNKPSNVDFLIATDGEMKKVNWTSKRELLGSTKVVIMFMFTIAIILFVLDLLFNTVFYYLNVLKQPWWKQVFGAG